MSKNLLPDYVNNLPAPWNFTDASRFQESLRGMNKEEQTGHNAVEMVERYLQALESLPFGGNDIPDVMMEFGFDQALSRAIPTLDDFTVEGVEQFLMTYAPDSIQETPQVTARRVGCLWLGSVFAHLIAKTLRWLGQVIRSGGMPGTGQRLLSVGERYWSKVDSRIIFPLISACTMVGSEALPLLDRIAQSETSPPNVRSAAEDYKRLVKMN